MNYEVSFFCYARNIVIYSGQFTDNVRILETDLNITNFQFLWHLGMELKIREKYTI